MSYARSHPGDETDGNSRCWSYAVLVVTAGGLMTGALLAVRPLMSANDRSRWCTVWSLVERHTYRIDEIIEQPGWDTIDKVRHQGHFYSSKPPWLSTVAAGVYWVGKHVFGWDLLQQTRQVTRSVLLLLNLVPALIALALMCVMCERYARSDFTRAFVAFSAAFGTLVTAFVSTFNNHTIAASCVTIAIYALLTIVVDERGDRRHFALAGLFAALACMSELPATLFALATFGVLLRHNPRKTLTVFVPVALVPLLFFFVTNYLATGGWKPFYLYYGTDKYEYIYRGIPSYWMHPAGLDRSLDSTFVYLLHCTIGHHGILSLSPVVLLSLCGWIRLARERVRGTSPPRAWNVVLWMGAGLTAVVLCFYLTRTQNYNYGGNSAGLRWMLWLVPFWLLAMIPALDAARSVGFRSLALVCLAVSTFSMAAALPNPWRHPWLFRVMSDWQWIDYDAKPPRFEPPRSTWFDRLPPDDGIRRWVEWDGLDGQGRPLRLRLTDLGSVTRAGRNLRRLEAQWQRGGRVEASKILTIDSAAFAAQKPVKQLVVWSDPAPPDAERQAVWSLLHGLPVVEGQSTYYRRYLVRYLETSMSADALACRRTGADAFVEVKSRRYRYHTDLWLSDVVTFGCAQLQQTVIDVRSGEIVSRRRLTVAREGRLQAAPPP